MRVRSTVVRLLTSVVFAGLLTGVIPATSAEAQPITCVTNTHRNGYARYGPCTTEAGPGRVDWMVNWPRETRGSYTVVVTSLDGEHLTTRTCDIRPSQTTCQGPHMTTAWARSMGGETFAIGAGAVHHQFFELTTPVHIRFTVGKNSMGAAFQGTIQFSVLPS